MKVWQKSLWLGVIGGVLILGALWRAGFFAHLGLQRVGGPLAQWSRQAVGQPSPTPLPLLVFTIPALQQREYQASGLTVEKKLVDTPTYTSYLFSFTTLGKKMTGMLNVPKTPAPTDGYPVIVMVRGYVPVESYATGVGTKPAAAVFAAHGYVTIAPDFFGYGGSDAEDTNQWVARFQKPLNVVELMKTIEGGQAVTMDNGQKVALNSHRLGMWAHSNGGQIALTALEILGQPIPTTLWAPVSAPFPYSILYFSDEDADEGHAARAEVAAFEKDYDVTQFSLTDFVSLLRGPLQIQQGLQDESIHYTWSEKFVGRIKKENDIRNSSSSSGQLKPIAVQLFEYPGTNHNMSPAWSTAIQRDLAFFAKELP